MSTLKKVCPHLAIHGLSLKRKVGEKIIIDHCGERLILQVAELLTGWRVSITFKSESTSFVVLREEIANAVV